MPDSSLPAITCLCPTYGRFQLLRRALACFLAQTYPNKHLVILNDAPAPLSLARGAAHGSAYSSEWVVLGLRIVNVEPGSTANLGEKRQWLLELAHTPLVALWDDDDVYLPWHLDDCVDALALGIGCTKVRSAWVLNEGHITGRYSMGNDASMAFWRDRALELGGYPPRQRGQNIGLLRKFEAAGDYRPLSQGKLLSFVRDGKPGAEGHNLAGNFHEMNQDFGDGQPLTPVDLQPLWRTIVRDTKELGLLNAEDHATLARRLHCD